jgi:nucleoid DNA-binding protein
MNKEQLIDAISEQDFTVRDAKRALNAITREAE